MPCSAVHTGARVSAHASSVLHLSPQGADDKICHGYAHRHDREQQWGAELQKLLLRVPHSVGNTPVAMVGMPSQKPGRPGDHEHSPDGLLVLRVPRQVGTGLEQGCGYRKHQRDRARWVYQVGQCAREDVEKKQVGKHMADKLESAEDPINDVRVK